MFEKKRWFDGLQKDFQHLNEFENKFYCCGGDGGSNGGGSGPTAYQNRNSVKSTEPSGFRGEQSTDPMKGASPAERQGISQERFDALSSISSNIQDAVNDPRQAPVNQQVSAPSFMQNAPVEVPSFTQKTTPSFYSPSIVTAGLPAMTPSERAPNITASQQRSADLNEGLSINSLSDKFGFEPSINFGRYSINFAKGGVVNQGIGSIFPRRRV